MGLMVVFMMIQIFVVIELLILVVVDSFLVMMVMVLVFLVFVVMMGVFLHMSVNILRVVVSVDMLFLQLTMRKTRLTNGINNWRRFMMLFDVLVVVVGMFVVMVMMVITFHVDGRGSLVLVAYLRHSHVNKY